MLFIFVRVELDTVWNLAIAKSLQAFPRLSVPQFHLAIIPTGKKLAAVVVKAQVFDGFDMAMKGAQAILMCINVPQLSTHRTQLKQTIEQFTLLTLILVSIDPLSMRCPVWGKRRMTDTPCVWPVQVCIQTFGMKQS